MASKSRVIHLTNAIEDEGAAAPRKKSRLARILAQPVWFATKLGALMFLSVYVYQQTLVGLEWGKKEWGEWRAWALQHVTIEKLIEVEREVVQVQPAETLSLAETIAIVSEESGIHALVFETIALMESASGRFVYRFEPDLYARLREKKEFKRYSNDELRMLASSHGDFHILGLTGQQQCSLKYHELYDRQKAARCVAKILTNLDAVNKDTKDRGERLRLMLTGYNGSGDRAAAYAERALGIIGEKLYSRLLS